MIKKLLCEKNLRRIELTLFLCMLLITIFNVLVLIKYNFKADSSFYVTLAREQLRTHRLFPDGVSYSTALFVLTPNLFMVPMLNWVGNVLLVRQLAILICWGAILVVLFFMMNSGCPHTIESYYLAAMLLLTNFLASEVNDMHFYQGAYISYVLFLIIYLWLSAHVITNERYNRICLVGIVLIDILANLGEIRNVLIFGIPSILAYCMYLYLENRNQASGIFAKENIITCSVLFVGCVLGSAGSIVLTRIYGGAETTIGMEMIASSKYGLSVTSYFEDLFAMYGNNFTAPLISPYGIYKCASFVVCICVCIILPIIAVKIYKKVESKTSKYIIIFCLTSNLVYSFITILVGGTMMTDRYLVPLYNNNAILFGIVIVELLKKYAVRYRKLVTVILMGYLLLANMFYINSQKDSLVNHNEGYYSQAVMGVDEFLIEHELDYGYATFYNAEEYSVLSNYEVEIHNVKVENDEMTNGKWLTVDRFYEPDNHEGKTFVMLTTEETERFAPNGIANTCFGEPVEKLQYDRFNIFVYDYNVAVRFKSE